MRSTEFDDPRVSYYWDKNKISGAEWQEVIDNDGVAWDIYFLYSPDDSWGDMPSYPSFFMNQIGIDEEISPRLDCDYLAAKIAEQMAK